MRPAIETWARDKTKLEASRLLAEQGIPAGPSNAAGDLYEDPHVAARDMLIEVPRPDAERPMLLAGNPVKLSGSPEGPVSRFPSLGEHTETVLRETLDLADADLAALVEDGETRLRRDRMRASSSNTTADSYWHGHLHSAYV